MQDSAGPPSRRYGYEINVTYQINRYLEFYGSFSGDHTRFTHPLDDGTGHLGDYITDAPVATGVARAVPDRSWALERRPRTIAISATIRCPPVPASTPRPCTIFRDVATCANAPTAPGQVNGKGFGETEPRRPLRVSRQAGAPRSASTICSTRTPRRRSSGTWIGCKSEIGTYPDGRADIHEHPLEPIMARLTIAKQF